MSSLLSEINEHMDCSGMDHLEGDVSLVKDMTDYIESQIVTDNFSTQLLRHNTRSGIVTKFNVNKQHRYIYVLNSITIDSGSLGDNDIFYIQCGTMDFGSYTLKYLCRMCKTVASKPNEFHFKKPFIWMANHDDIIIGCVSYAAITFDIIKIPFNIRKNLPKHKLIKYKNLHVTRNSLYKCILPRITQTFVYNMSSNIKHNILDRHYSVLQGLFIESPLIGTRGVIVDIEINVYQTITKTYSMKDLIKTAYDNTYYLPFTDNVDYDNIEIYYTKGINIRDSLRRCSFTLKSNISFPFKVYSYKPIDYQIHSQYHMVPWIAGSTYYCNDEYSYYTNQWTAEKYDMTE